MASDFKRGYVCGTPEEGNIVIKEEMEDEAAFVDLLMRQNDHQNDGGPYRAGNVGQLNIKEEAELTSEETPLPIASKPLFKLANVKPGPTFACTVCRASFPDNATTLEHIRTSHSSNGHYRQRATKSKEDEAAKSTTKGNKPIIIYWSAIPTPHPSQEVENRDFHSQTGLAIHERVHQSETARVVKRKRENSETPRMGRGRGRSLSCPLCPRILSRSWEMPEHLELHQAASAATCSLCGAVYRGEPQLAIHRTKVHPEAVEPPKPKKQKVRPAPEKKEKPKKKIKSSTENLAEPTSYPCHLCPSVYTLRNSLNQHTRRKHPPSGAEPLIGRHLCDHCGKACFSAYNLANHTRVHTGERPYSCTECQYRGSTRSHLTIHQKVHLKDTQVAVTEPKAKPFPCTACPRSFTHSAKLAKHLLDHTLPSPFVCPQCGALYPTSAPLQRHQTLVHPTEVEADNGNIKRDSRMKRWICPHCPRRFSHKDKLYTHLEQHKDPASPRCTLCGVVYRLESHLQLHQVRVHQMGELNTGKICSEGDLMMSGDDQMSSNSEWPVPEDSREWDDDLEEEDYDLEEDDEEEEEIVFCKTVL